MQTNNFFSLEQIIDRQPLTLSPETLLTEVIKQMQEWANSCYLTKNDDTPDGTEIALINNSCALVIEEERLQGIFTERDLVRLIATERDLARITVSEVISRELITLTLTGKEDIFTALKLLRQHRIRHLPVIDENDRLLGLITTKSIRQNLQPINLMKWRRVEEIMETNTVHALPTLSVRQAARLMTEHQVSYVAIVEPDNNLDGLLMPVGIITERDIVRFQTLNLDLAQPVKKLMSTPLFLVSPEDSLWSVHQQMQQLRVRRLLIAGSQGELRGIITQNSLLQVFDPTEMYEVIEILQRQVSQLENERIKYLQNHTTELEKQVRERTSEIAKTNQQLQQEIKQRHQAEASQRKNQERYSLVVVGSGNGIWDWDIVTNEVFYAPRFREILGYTEEEMANTYEAWVTKLHPEDRDRTLAALQEHIKHNVSYHIEYRLQKKDRAYCWVEAYGQALWNEAGQPVRMAGSIADISERKYRENILRDIASGITIPTGANFLSAFAQYLCKTLKVDFAFIGKIIQPDEDSIKTLAMHGKGHIIDNSEYLIAGTPCEKVIEQELCIYPEAIQQLFPDDQMLPEMAAESYAGISILSSTGKTFGLIGILDSKPLDSVSLIEEVLTILATRITAELNRKQAEAKIKEQAALLDITTDAIMVQGLNSQILFWNQGAEKIYGWTKQEALNRNIHELLLYSESSTEIKDITRSLQKQDQWQGELNQLTKSGKKIVVESRWTLVKDEAENPQSILVVNTDITEQKKLEAQFFRTQRLESLGTLASGIAHDLNNILAPILGFAQLLPHKLTNLDQQTLEFFKIMETNARRGTALVNQILTFSQGLEGDRGIVQVRHLITEISKIITETFPKKIELEIDAPKNLWTLDADATQIHQVLMNLAVNARDAMPQGGKLRITAENFPIDANFARIHIDAHEGSYILITVADTGIGMSPEILDRVFEPFFTTKGIGHGTGLGLSTAIGIVKSHGGFIDVYSEARRGTQFKVFLPACEMEEELFVEEELPQGNGELILVVDDETHISQAVQATLETFNYQVLTANNGIEAIALYAQNQNAIDVVLTDIMMPSMDGETLIPIIKKINPDIKVIVFSGLISNREIVAKLDGSIAAFINKPYTTEVLLKTIHQVVNSQ